MSAWTEPQMQQEPPGMTAVLIERGPQERGRTRESAQQRVDWKRRPRTDSPQHPSSERTAPWGLTAVPAKTGLAGHGRRERRPLRAGLASRKAIRQLVQVPTGRAQSAPHSRLDGRLRRCRPQASSRTEARRDVLRSAESAHGTLRSAEVGSANHGVRMKGCFGNRCR